MQTFFEPKPTPPKESFPTRYGVHSGIHAGKEGVMIGRFADPSYNDIQLLFPDGTEAWLSYNATHPVASLQGMTLGQPQKSGRYKLHLRRHYPSKPKDERTYEARFTAKTGEWKAEGNKNPIGKGRHLLPPNEPDYEGQWEIIAFQKIR